MIIAFEGIDGAGKTTTSELVFRHLVQRVPNLRYYTRKTLWSFQPRTKMNYSRWYPTLVTLGDEPGRVLVASGDNRRVPLPDGTTYFARTCNPPPCPPPPPHGHG